jgi:hypothetical protein
MNLNVPIIQSSELSWEAADGCAELSDLSNRGIFGQIYPGGADPAQGFAIRSEESGRVVIFRLTREFFDNNTNPEEIAEVTHWQFYSVLDTNGAAVHGIKVTIFND